MKKYADVSVLISNYNYGKYIEKCLSRLCDQTLQFREIIIIDDCSSDNSVRIINKFRKQYKHIKFYQNKKNLGLVTNQKKLLKMAKSKYIYWASTDDYVEKNFLEYSYSALIRYPQASLIFSYSCFIRKNKLTLIKRPKVKKVEYFTGLQINKILRQIGHFNCNSIIFEKKKFIELGAFLHEKLKWHYDMIIYHAMAFDTGAVFVPKKLAIHRNHENQWSSNKDKKNLQIILKYYFLELENNPRLKHLNSYFVSSTIHALFNGSFFYIMKNKKFYKYLNFFYLKAVMLKKIKIFLKSMIKIRN